MKGFRGVWLRLGLAAILFIALLIASIGPAIGAPLGATPHTFNYTITATGTASTTTYPDQAFNWTVETTATIEWREPAGAIGADRYSVYGYEARETYYLKPPKGYVITGFKTQDVDRSRGGRDDGTYIDAANNRLVVKVASGGDRRCAQRGLSGCLWYATYPGWYGATYTIYGDVIRSGEQSIGQTGSGVVNATEGWKTISPITTDPFVARPGTTITYTSRTAKSDNPNVAVKVELEPTGHLVAKTDYSETTTQPWSATETGAGSVSFDEGDKLIATSTLAAPDGNTTYKFTSDNSAVETWMTGNQLWARVKNTPPIAQAESYSTHQGGILTVAAPGVLANDSDPDGNSLSAVLVSGSGPSHGTLSLNADGSFTYTPNVGWFGSDSFSYRASDGGAESAPVAVSITVDPVLITAKLGFLAPLSGSWEVYGVSSQQGFDMAVEETNASGSVTFTPVKADDARLSDGTPVDGEMGAGSQANWLVGQGVNAIVGPISTYGHPAASVAEASGTVLISPSATGPGLTVDPDTGIRRSYVFRAPPVDPSEARNMARLALSDPEIGGGSPARSAAIIYASADPIQKPIAEGFRDAFVAGGGRVDVMYGYPTGQTVADLDFSAQFNTIRTQGTQVLYLPVYFDAAGIIAAKAKAAGVTSTMLGWSGWESPSLDTATLAGGYFTVFFAADDPRPVAQKWVADYRVKYGANATPDAMAALTYDSTRLVAMAMEQQGSSDPTKVRDGLAQIRDFEGPSGKISYFDANGNPVKTHVVVKVGDHHWSYYQTVNP